MDNGHRCILSEVFSRLSDLQSDHFFALLKKIQADTCRGANPVSSFGGGGIIGQTLPKFAISRVWGIFFL